MHYTCPVCGYPDLENPPEDHLICPSCGTQFGYDDVGHSYAELRKMWVASGAEWFLARPPLAWNPWLQLIMAGFSYDLPFRVDMVTVEEEFSNETIVLVHPNEDATNIRFVVAYV